MIIKCLGCGIKKQHWARGLCVKCWNIAAENGFDPADPLAIMNFPLFYFLSAYEKKALKGWKIEKFSLNEPD